MPKIVSEEMKYNGKRFKIMHRMWEDDKNTLYERDTVETSSGAIILPITENNEVVFIKQYREAIEQETLELPAGMIEENESPIEAAKRELEEETGLAIPESDAEQLVTVGRVMDYLHARGFH